MFALFSFCVFVFSLLLLDVICCFFSIFSLFLICFSSKIDVY